MIKEKVPISFFRLIILVALTWLSLSVVSCKTTKEYCVYQEGANIYHYTECLNKFVVKLNEGLSYEEVNNQLDSLGLVIEFDSQLGRDVCRRIDGRNFERDSCWEIAHLRSLDGVWYCAAIMEMHDGKVLNNYGDTIHQAYENTFWEVPGRVKVISISNYGEASGFIDSLIISKELRYINSSSWGFSECQRRVKDKFICTLEAAPELFFGTIDMEQEINREHGAKVYVQQTLEK